MGLEEELLQFIGTTQYHRSTFGTLNITDGVHYLTEKATCFWLIDLIESFQPKLRGIDFQIWGIKVDEDKTAVIYCKEDSNKKPVVLKKIGFTDFPLKNSELYCVDNVVLLKTEY